MRILLMAWFYRNNSMPCAGFCQCSLFVFQRSKIEKKGIAWFSEVIAGFVAEPVKTILHGIAVKIKRIGAYPRLIP